MDGILPDGRTGRLWMCKKHDGHALGLHIRVKENDLHLDLLLEFRNAVNVESTEQKIFELIDVQTSGTLEGTKRDIECTICGSKRTWWMGEAAFERFVDNRKRRSAVVEVNHAS